MIRTVFTVIFFLVVLGALWMPGFLLAIRMVKGIEGREPEIGDYILACIPGFNLAVARKALYNSATCVYVVYGLFIVNSVLRVISLAEFVPVLISLISLVIMWVMILVVWGFTAYLLIDMANCVGCGFVVKALSVVFPPVAQYCIAVSCPNMEELEDEEDVE